MNAHNGVTLLVILGPQSIPQLSYVADYNWLSINFI